MVTTPSGITEHEAIASLRVLVAIAKADGTLHPQERAALESAIFDLTLPAGTTLESLLAEKMDFLALLDRIQSKDAREQLYQSAYALAHADGDYAPAEKRLVEHIAAKYQIGKEQVSFTSRLFAEAKDTVLPSNIQPITDPARRAAEIKEDVTKYSVFAAVLGAFPIPGVAIATDLAAVAVQVKMVRDIGQYYGHTIDKEAAKTLLASLGIGTGARIAVTNLAKFVPMWGSVFGAGASYAATWALGKIAVHYFDGGMKSDIASLRVAMKAAEKEGKEAFNKSKSAIAAKEKEHKAKLEALNADFKAGKLTQAEYEAKVASLV